jgi:hypothetical protein
VSHDPFAELRSIAAFDDPTDDDVARGEHLLAKATQQAKLDRRRDSP